MAQIVLCLPYPLIGCAQARRVWFRSFMVLLHPLRDGCLRLQLCPFCGSGSIPLFFDNERPGLHLQPGAFVFAGKLMGRDRNDMEKPPLARAAAVLVFAHAPLAGRDSSSRSSYRPCWHFNPRAPCGARRSRPHGRRPETEFKQLKIDCSTSALLRKRLA